MTANKILHIAPDEKFINAANYLYEKAFPGRNIFFIIIPASNPPLKYVNPEAHFKIYARSPELNRVLVEAFKTYRLIVFHGLSRDMAKAFNLSEDKEKFIWTFWGAEIYNSDMYDECILGPKTKLIEEKIRRGTVLDSIKRLYRKVKYRKLNDGRDIDYRKVIKQFRYIAKLNENITLLKSKKLVRDDCKTIFFTYYPLEFLFNDGPDKTVNGDNILLGNSSSTTNNHIEMIDFLAGLDVGKKKVITPLSYGHKRYASIIKEYGLQKLGNSFYPLLDFLPMQEYHKLINSCSLVIMNHYRPQAVGTSLACLYMGAKLFLNNTTFFRYLKGIGCHVYSIGEDLIENTECALESLTPLEIEHNRRILEKEISTEVVAKKLKSSIQKHFNFVEGEG